MLVRGKQITKLVLAVLVLSLVLGSVTSISNADAAQITSRSLTLQAGASDGGSKPGGVVRHLIGFTTATTGNVGSIQFLYCTTASGTCTTPTGLLTTAATLTAQTGATGFTLNNTTNGSPYITRAAASITTGTALTYQLSTVTNPTTANQTFFVRISTFASIDTTGGATDTGTVAASTATQIVLTGTMPESLIFCTGGTISTTGGVPDCTTATSGAVSFTTLFSPTATSTATSQMAASTNAGTGYSITINGPTMTSGANTITAMNAAATSTVGTSQFGTNLRANTTPAIGTDVTPAANGTNFKGTPQAGYATVNTFKFLSADTVAASNSGGAGPSDAQIYTNAYIVNVPGSQAAGTYTSTLTYICTATY